MSKKTKIRIKKTSIISTVFSLSVVMIVAVASFLNISFFPPKVEIQEINEAKASGESWYSTGGAWNYRKKITIDHTKVANVDYPETTYANFPLLVSTTGLSNIKENGADIRFTMADGITEIPREIEKYDSGNLEAWVKLTLTKDFSDSTDDVIYMYYGNSSATEPLADSTYGSESVWDSNFKMVQHLQEDPSGIAPQMIDSTSLSNDGTSGGTMLTENQVAGQIGGAVDFDEIDDFINAGSDSSLDDLHLSGGLTMSAWINPRTAGISDSGRIVDKRAGQVGYMTFSLYGSGLYFAKHGSTNLLVRSSQSNVTFNQLQQVTVVWDGSAIATNVHFYINGLETTYAIQTDGASLVSDASQPLYIGGPGFDGIIDEVRISDIARSAEWIETEFNNQSDVSVFAIFSSTETNISCAIAGGACQTNVCSIYVNCAPIDGLCDTGYCCSVTCSEDTTAPSVPTNLSATALSMTEIDLSWTTSIDDMDVTGYKIYRDSVEIDTTTNTTYSDIGLSQSTTYTYTVSAYDAIPNTSAQSSSAQATTEDPDIIAPANINNLSVSSCTSISCVLSWTAPGDNNNTGTATTYDIRYSTVNITDANWSSATQVIGESSPHTAGTTEAFAVSGLASETTYYFAIKTADEIPNTSGLSNTTSEETGRGINAVSCERDDVLAAIDLAVDGDTVAVPAGECAWSSGISIPNDKKIILQGSGIDQTVISGSGILIFLKDSGSRITGFTFYGGGIETQGTGWRIDHCKIHKESFMWGVVAKSSDAVSGIHSEGLIDNCILYNARVLAVAGDGPGFNRDWQHRYWNAPLNLGTTNNTIYIEDCNITSTVINNIDASYGGAYIARFNTITSQQMEIHSIQATMRAGRKWEIYANRFENPGTSYWCPFFIRAGTGVIWGNTLSGNWGFEEVWIDNLRSNNSAGESGQCDGTSLWDGNVDDPIYGNTGWPCRDQIGRSTDDWLWTVENPYPTQKSDPAYLWLNRTDSDAILPVNVVNNSSQHIKVDRDYYNEAEFFNGTSGVGTGLYADMPATCTTNVAYWATDRGDWNSINAGPDGQLYKCVSTNNWELYYTPYTYPHPLQAGVTPSDTTSPSRYSGSPTGNLNLGTTNTTISLSTNESATCKYSTTLNTAYASMTNTFTTTGATTHSQAITGLTDDSTYNYYVRCADVLDNINTTDYTISFSISDTADTTSPTATISINSNELTNSLTATLNISASDPSTVTEMKISNTNNFSSAVVIAYTTVKEWILTTGDGIKTVYAWFKDGVGNWTSENSPKTDTITLDITVPTRSNGSPTGTLNSGTTQTTISLTTNENATCKYSTTPNTAYASITNTFTTTGGTTHSQTITGLSNGNDYSYFVRCIDTATNVNITDYAVSFSVSFSSGGGGGLPPSASNPPSAPESTVDNQQGGFKVLINNNDESTNNQTVALKLFAGEDTTNMALSNREDFAGASIIPFQETMEWDLSKNLPSPYERGNTNDVNEENIYTVYAKFYTQYGVASEVVSDSILYVGEANSNPDIEPTPDIIVSNGSLIKAIDDFKVYIINGNNYVRHIIDEIIFSFYSHLNKSDIQEISSLQLNSYEKSFLIRAFNDYKVYEIKDGKKQWLDITVEEFIEQGYNWEEVFIVNEEELGWYQ